MLHKRHWISASIIIGLWHTPLLAQEPGMADELFESAFEKAIDDSPYMTAIAEVEPDTMAQIREMLRPLATQAASQGLSQGELESALAQNIASMSIQLLTSLVVKYSAHSDDDSIYAYYRSTIDLQNHAFRTRLETCASTLDGDGSVYMQFLIEQRDDPAASVLIDAQQEAAAEVVRSGAGLASRDVASVSELESYVEDFNERNPELASALESNDRSDSGYRMRCGAQLAMFEAILSEPPAVGAPILRSLTALSMQ